MYIHASNFRHHRFTITNKREKGKGNADIQLRLIFRQYLPFDNPLIHFEDEHEPKVNYAYTYEDKGARSCSSMAHIGIAFTGEHTGEYGRYNPKA